MTEEQKSNNTYKYIWLVYLALIVGAILMLGDGLNIKMFTKLTTKLGITVLLSALFLIVGKSRPSGIIALSIIWVSFIITLLT